MGLPFLRASSCSRESRSAIHNFRLYLQETARYTYSGSTDFGTGKSGVFSDKTGVKFDDFVATVGAARDPKVMRMSGLVSTTLNSGVL